MSKEIVEKQDPPKPVANPQSTTKYKYIGPADAEKVLIPKTVKSILVKSISDAEIDALFQTYPYGMAKLFELRS